MAESNNENENPARQPRNLQGLLRFALEATRAEDAPHPSNFQVMDPERRRFLEEAVNSMTINVIEQLDNAIQILTDTTSNESHKVHAIDIIMDYVDNMDTANDFCTIGGLSIIMTCIETSPYAMVRSKAASLIAELSQNNPFCQKKLLEMDALPKLLNLLSDNETSISGLRAISCMVRCYEPCSAAFIDIGGLECILGCLQSDQDKLVIQSLFLMCSLGTEYPGVRDELVKIGAVEHIVQILRPSPEFDIRLEATLSLLNLLTENIEAATRCRESHLNIRLKLQEIVKMSQGKIECRETIEFSESILFKLFDSSEESNADR